MNITTPTFAQQATSRSHRSLLLLVTALVVALLAGFCNPLAANATPSIPAGTTYETRIASATESLLNHERALHHLPAVHMRRALMTSAHQHNLAMARANTMSHQVRGEASLGTRIARTGYDWTWAGENIGWNSTMNTGGVLALERAMYNEVAPNDGHRLNILNSHFKNVGIDVYLDYAHHKVWLTVDFGRL